jgi:homoserine trans-succinylase
MKKESKIILALFIVFCGAISANASIKLITGFEKSEIESKITGVYSNNQITEITDSA